MSAKVKNSELNELLKRELNTTKLIAEGRTGRGCISEGKAYDTDSGKVFVKINSSSEAKEMFDGEAASLKAIDVLGVVKVPKPIKVITVPSGGCVLVMENLDIVGGLSSKATILGEQLARLHLKNAEAAAKEEQKSRSVHKEEQTEAVRQFGFDVPTCCGYIPQNNQWAERWEDFFARKLQLQVALLQQNYNDRDASQEWSTLQRKLPKFFTGLSITPALLHGDLWSGNVAEIADAPVIFDPASFYGHSEFDLSISHLFGGFSRAFFNNYHKLIPKQEGYDKRLELYKLFHYVNHWNHFGEGYKQPSMDTFRRLNKMKVSR